jgi:hypothetical protein
LRQVESSRAVANALGQTPGDDWEADQIRQRQAERIATCAANTVLKLVTPTDDATRIVQRNSRYCRNMLCMTCARYRAYFANQKFMAWIDELRKAQPQTRFAFCTLTSRNRPLTVTRDMFVAHEAALTRFWRRRTVSRSITGHITSLEIALRQSRAGEWQAGVHSHSLLVLADNYFEPSAGLYLSQPAFVKLWQEALQVSYAPICYVSAIPQAGDVRGALRELLKYAVAPHKLFHAHEGVLTAEPFVVTQLADALYKRRLTRFGGVFSGAQRRLRAKQQGEAS